MQQDTTVIIVSYNSAHLLEERLKAYSDRPVIVVDNASADGTVALVSSSFPEVRLIANEVNGGFGRGANLGFEQVETPYALLVNPDARIGPEGIAALEAEAGRLEDDWLFIAPNIDLPLDAIERVSPTLERVREAYGAALLFDMKSLRRIGGFDPNIFLFFEETDLCRRARDAGLGLYYAHDIFVEHEIGTSTHRTIEVEALRKWHYNWSRLYYLKKYRLWGELLRILWRNLVVASVKLRVPGRDASDRTRLRARQCAARAFLRGREAFQPSGAPCVESTWDPGLETFVRG